MEQLFGLCISGESEDELTIAAGIDTQRSLNIFVSAGLVNLLAVHTDQLIQPCPHGAL